MSGRRYVTRETEPCQIIDDILDVTADSATLGKTAGKDLLVDKVHNS